MDTEFVGDMDELPERPRVDVLKADLVLRRGLHAHSARCALRWLMPRGTFTCTWPTA